MARILLADDQRDVLEALRILLKTPSGNTPAPNQTAMQRPASRNAFCFMSVCHRHLDCESRFTGLGVADLVSR